MPFFLKFLKLWIILIGHIIIIFSLQCKLIFQFMNFTSIEILNSHNLWPHSFIFKYKILILMKKIIDFKLNFRNYDLFSTKLIFQFDKFILKLNPQFPLTIKIILKFLFGFFEFLSLVLKHVLQLSEIMLIASIYKYNKYMKYFGSSTRDF